MPHTTLLMDMCKSEEIFICGQHCPQYVHGQLRERFYYHFIDEEMTTMMTLLLGNSKYSVHAPGNNYNTSNQPLKLITWLGLGT